MGERRAQPKGREVMGRLTMASRKDIKRPGERGARGRFLL